jgi:glycosyltransferase involved in cell wall biosynthesis
VSASGPPRVVYVVHADPGNVTPADVLERWPTAASTVAALAATKRCDVYAVALTRGPSTIVNHKGVAWQFVHSRSRGAWRVAQAVRCLRPDIVHVNSLLAAIPTLALRITCGTRPRTFVQHHGEPPGTGRTRRAQAIVRRVVNGYLFTGAEGQAVAWRNAGILRPDTPTFEVIESSSDLAALSPMEARALTGVVGDPAIVWVGRLIDGKDPRTALDAFERLGSDHSAHLWLLYSNATLERSLRESVEASPMLQDRVHFVGHVPHHDISAWFSSADIVLSTSRREGSGYALIEALGCGCTPIVTDIAPHRSIVGSLGRQFPVGDVDACAAAIAGISLLQREVVCADFARRLSWTAVAAQLLDAYGVAAPEGTTTIGQSA